MDVYGLIGYPLSHSFSKKYFTEKFEKEGLEDTYELFPIEDIRQLTTLIRANPLLKGLNVTIPHKQSILAYIDDATGIPPGLGACNCIKIVDEKLIGYNTDVTGFEKSIAPFLGTHHKKALILGNGGAAEAVKYVFSKNNIVWAVVSRKLHGDASFTYNELTDDMISDHTIIVNTTPLGMFPSVDSCADIPYDAIGKNHLLYDLVYNPSKTLFLEKGEQMGATIMNGYAMLVLQAEESWRIWQENS